MRAFLENRLRSLSKARDEPPSPGAEATTFAQTSPNIAAALDMTYSDQRTTPNLIPLATSPNTPTPIPGIPLARPIIDRRRSILLAQDSPTAHIRRQRSLIESSESSSAHPTITRKSSEPGTLSSAVASTFGRRPTFVSQPSNSNDVTRSHHGDLEERVQSTSGSTYTSTFNPVGAPLSPPPAARTPTKVTPPRLRTDQGWGHPVRTEDLSEVLLSGASSPSSPSPTARISPIPEVSPLPNQSRFSRSSASVSPASQSRHSTGGSSSGQNQRVPSVISSRPSSVGPTNAPFRVSFVNQPTRNTPSPHGTLQSHSSRSRASITPPDARRVPADDPSPATLSTTSSPSPSTSPGPFTRLAALIHSPSLTFASSPERSIVQTPELPVGASQPVVVPTGTKQIKSRMSLGEMGSTSHNPPKKHSTLPTRAPARRASDSPLETRTAHTNSPASSSLPFTFGHSGSPRYLTRPSRGRFVSSPGNIVTTPPHNYGNEGPKTNSGENNGEKTFGSDGSPIPTRERVDSNLSASRRKSADWSSRAASSGPGSWQQKVAEEMVRLSFMPGGSDFLGPSSALAESPKHRTSPSIGKKSSKGSVSDRKTENTQPRSSTFGVMDVPATPLTPTSRYATASEGGATNNSIKPNSGSRSNRSSSRRSSAHQHNKEDHSGSSRSKGKGKGKGRGSPRRSILKERSLEGQDVQVHVVGEDDHVDPEHMIETWRLNLEIPNPQLGFTDSGGSIVFKFGSQENKGSQQGTSGEIQRTGSTGTSRSSPSRRARLRGRERKLSGSGSIVIQGGRAGSQRRTTSLMRQNPPYPPMNPAPSRPAIPAAYREAKPAEAKTQYLLPIPASPAPPSLRIPKHLPSQSNVMERSSPNNSPSKGKGKRSMEEQDDGDIIRDTIGSPTHLSVDGGRERTISNISEMFDKVAELPPYRRKRLKRSNSGIRVLSHSPLQPLAAIAVNMASEAPAPPGNMVMTASQPSGVTTQSQKMQVVQPVAGPSNMATPSHPETIELRSILSKKNPSLAATEVEERVPSRTSSRRSQSVSFTRALSPAEQSAFSNSPSGSQFPPSAYVQRTKRASSDRRRRHSSIITPGGTIPMRAIFSPRPPSMAAGKTGIAYHLREPKKYGGGGSLGNLDQHGGSGSVLTSPRSVRSQPPLPDTGLSPGANTTSHPKMKQWVDVLPFQGWAFFLGFVIPIFWWASALTSVSRTDEETGTTTVHTPSDIIIWRRRCRLMVGFSILVYVPVITLAVIFGRK